MQLEWALERKALVERCRELEETIRLAHQTDQGENKNDSGSSNAGSDENQNGSCSSNAAKGKESKSGTLSERERELEESVKTLRALLFLGNVDGTSKNQAPAQLKSPESNILQRHRVEHDSSFKSTLVSLGSGRTVVRNSAVVYLLEQIRELQHGFLILRAEMVSLVQTNLETMRWFSESVQKLLREFRTT